MGAITARLGFHKDVLVRAFVFTLAASTVCGAVVAGTALRGASRTVSGAALRPDESDQKNQSRLTSEQENVSAPGSAEASQVSSNATASASAAPAGVGSWHYQEFTFVEVVDGRTFRAGGTTIRLTGIELPNPDQVCRTLDNRLEQCAARAATQLELLTRSRALACRYRMITSSEAVGACRIGSGDLAARMIRTGYAQRAADAGEMKLDAPPAAEHAAIFRDMMK